MHDANTCTLYVHVCMMLIHAYYILLNDKIIHRRARKSSVHTLSVVIVISAPKYETDLVDDLFGPTLLTIGVDFFVGTSKPSS